MANTCVDSSKKTFVNLLKTNSRIGVATGGIEEIICYRYRQEIIYLKKRKGFIKYALEFGYPVIPVYGFGESDCYKVWPITQMIGKFTNKYFGFAFPWGEG